MTRHANEARWLGGRGQWHEGHEGHEQKMTKRDTQRRQGDVDSLGLVVAKMSLFIRQLPQCCK